MPLMKTVSTWRCKCGVSIKAVGETDRTKPVLPHTASCPKCGFQQPVYVDRIGFKLESIADIDIGWMEIRKHTIAPKGKQLGERIYSSTQIGYSQKFIEWMQQSYIPKGCLGDVAYYQNDIPKFSGTNSLLGNAINMNGNALPHLYGAYSKM